MIMDINATAKEIHKWAREKGFYKTKLAKDGTSQHICGSIAAQLMLIVTELAEACEADRKKDRANLKEEIADTAIRLFDFAAAQNINLNQEIATKMRFNSTRPHKHGKRY